MNILLGIVVVILFFYLYSKDVKLSSSTPPPDIAYPFHDHSYFPCPKCSRHWKISLQKKEMSKNKNHKKYGVFCECPEYHTGHFHMCCPLSNDTQCGCGFEWIMKTLT